MRELQEWLRPMLTAQRADHFQPKKRCEPAAGAEGKEEVQQQQGEGRKWPKGAGEHAKAGKYVPLCIPFETSR